MQDFKFLRPTSLADAVKALGADSNAKLLAGGQSLLPVLKLNLAAPSALISLSAIGQLRGIRRDGATLTIGAATTHAEVAASNEVKGAIGALSALAEQIGDAQVRNRGTLGGSVAHNDPSADYPAALLALNATIVTDRREISADAFFTGMFETALAKDEIVTAVKFPVPARAGYAKFPNPASKYAIVGVMVAQGPAGVRVAVTGAAPCVFRFEAAEKALAKRFGADAIDGLGYPAEELLSDLHAAPDYRAHLVPVMTKRAVAAA
jgi:carbon-monoxide dehydrogenase medium subunit